MLFSVRDDLHQELSKQSFNSSPLFLILTVRLSTSRLLILPLYEKMGVAVKSS